MRNFEDDNAAAAAAAAAADAARAVRRPAVVALIALARKVVHTEPSARPGDRSTFAIELDRSMRRTAHGQ